MKLKGDIGGRYIIENNKEDVFEISMQGEEGIIDIDRIRDYLKYKELKT